VTLSFIKHSFKLKLKQDPQAWFKPMLRVTGFKRSLKLV